MMSRIKQFFMRLWHRILNPSLVQAAIATVIGSALIAVAIVLSMSGTNDIGAYVCYSLSLLALVYIGYIVYYGYPRVKQRTLEVASRYEFTANLVKNYGYRTMVVAGASIFLNAIYAVYNGAIALHYSSLWSALFAVYYVLLCALRGGILTGTRRKGNEGKTDGERRLHVINLYIRSGMLLIVFTLLIIVGIVRLAVAGSGVQQSQYLIYVSAIYTFLRFGFAVHNIRKAKKFDDFGTKALRNIGFADALVALFTLQMSMTSAFGGGGDFSRIIGMVTGSSVCAIIIFMGIYMIVVGKRALRTRG